MTTKLDCLTVSKELIALKCDWDTKALIAYIQFRLNHPSVKWTFSQTDICRALGMPKTSVSRLFLKFTTNGVFTLEGTQNTKNGLTLKIYQVNLDRLRSFVLAQSRNGTVPNRKDSSETELLQSRTGTYKNDKEKNDSKRKSIESITVLGVQGEASDHSSIEPQSKEETMKPLNPNETDILKKVWKSKPNSSEASQKAKRLGCVKSVSVTVPAVSALPSSSPSRATEHTHIGKDQNTEKTGMPVSAPLSKEERYKARKAFIDSLEVKFKDVPQYQRDLRIQVELAKYDQQGTKPKSNLNGFGAFN